jgi:hypothetical protein
MTRYEKITISLPSRAAESARKAVKDGHASSVSAYIVEALEMQTKTDNWDEVFEQMMEETGGPMQPWEERAADRALGLLPDGRPDPNAPQIIYARKVFEEERLKHERELRQTSRRKKEKAKAKKKPPSSRRKRAP